MLEPGWRVREHNDCLLELGAARLTVIIEQPECAQRDPSTTWYSGTVSVGEFSRGESASLAAVLWRQHQRKGGAP
jgi:hypothetical protein